MAQELDFLQEALVFVAQAVVVAPAELEVVAGEPELLVGVLAVLGEGFEGFDVVGCFGSLGQFLGEDGWVRGWDGMGKKGGGEGVPLVRISHLLDLDPWFEGICERRFSKRSFISLRRLRSAIL